MQIMLNNKLSLNLGSSKIFKNYNRYKKILSLKAWAFYCALERKIPKLKNVIIEVTKNCNLNCIHCCVDSKVSHKEEITILDIRRVFENISKNFDKKEIIVCLTGGEPLVRNDIFSIIKEIRDFDFYVTMVTNGTLLTEKKVKLLKESGIKEIGISLDGNEEFNLFLKQRQGVFEKVIQGIKNLINENYFNITILTMVSSQNIDQLDFIKSIILDLNINNWRISPFIQAGRGKNSLQIGITGKDYKKMIEYIIKTKNEFPQLKIYSTCSGFLGPEYELSIRNHYYKCLAGINALCIMSDGSISGCPMLCNENFFVGNIKQNDITSLWENDFSMYRELSWKRNQFCKGCYWWSNCLGEGHHIWDFERKRPITCTYRNVNSI